MQSPSDERWYRQGWPWFLLLLPAAVVVASFVTLWIALDNPQSTVRDDYYRHGLALNRRIEQAEAARARGLRAELEVARDGSLTLHVTPFEGLPEALELALVHPTDGTQDRTLRLTRQAPGRYGGRLAEVPGGKRYLRLAEPAGGAAWALQGTLGGSRTQLTPSSD